MAWLQWHCMRLMLRKSQKAEKNTLVSTGHLKIRAGNTAQENPACHNILSGGDLKEFVRRAADLRFAALCRVPKSAICILRWNVKCAKGMKNTPNNW